MKVLTIFIIVIFLLATGGIVLLYLAQPTPEVYYGDYPEAGEDTIEFDKGTGEILEFTGSLEEFWDS